MKILCYLTMMLVCGSVAMAEETFFSALESKAEVEKRVAPLMAGASSPVNLATASSARKLAMSFTSRWKTDLLTLMKARSSYG